ncbi:MAG: TonB-dependent receptor plug domain-containing protein [Gammaproteobacteria bacterium]|jgi:iron complex outermembrane receptor protein|nr:TonB-dependent receptor plug domain-containing protein [Gammaproteobacteria bacterium]
MKQLYKNMLLAPVVSLVAVSAYAAEAKRQEVGAAVSTITAEELERYKDSDIERLITTARRSEENLLEVPIAISTLTQEDIEKGGIRGIADVAAFTPGLSFANFFGEALPKPVIRGVAPVSIFGEDNTAVFIDGVFVSSTTGINLSFIDFERIEVLKGPQGAYFGNNSFAGAINYVTRKPSDELAINTEITAGTYDTLRAAASIEGPLVGDVLSGRVSFLYDDFGGTYNNQADIDQDIGGRKYKTVAGSLFYTPVDSFSAQWNLYYSDDEIDPPAQSTVPAGCQGQRSTSAPFTVNQNRKQNFCGEVPRAGQDDLFTIPGEIGQLREVFRTTLNMNWSTDIGTFSSLTGFSETTDVSFDNGNPGAPNTIYSYLTQPPQFGPPFGSVQLFDAGGLLFQNAGESDNKDFSQELRFTSPVDRSVRYTLGAYYFKQDFNSPQPWASVRAENPKPADFAAFCPLCITIFPGAAISPFSAGDSAFGPWFSQLPNRNAGYVAGSTRDVAVFGSIEVDFTSRLTGYADIRYTDRSVVGESFTRQFDYDIATDTINEANTIESFERTKNDTDYITWRASLSYAATENSTVYGSVATGEKGGGVDSFTITGSGDPLLDNTIRQVTFDPESNITYELGYKSALNEGRTVLDASVYYIDWSDIVIPVINDTIPDPNNPGQTLPVLAYTISQNAGDASIKGGEFSVRSSLSDYVDVGFGASYNRAKLDRGNVESFARFPAFSIEGDMSGQTLPRQPELQLNANVTFRDQLTGDWDWFVRGDAFYQSRWYVGLPNQAQIPSRIISNLRLGIESEQFSVEFWARNLFDNDAPTAAFRDPYFSNALQQNGGSSTGGFDNFFPWRLSIANAERRVIGMTVRARFGG